MTYHGYDALWEALTTYRAHQTGKADHDYTDLMYYIPDEQLEVTVPSLRHVIQQMSRDPLWGTEHSEELAASQ